MIIYIFIFLILISLTAAFQREIPAKKPGGASFNIILIVSILLFVLAVLGILLRNPLIIILMIIVAIWIRYIRDC